MISVNKLAYVRVFVPQSLMMEFREGTSVPSTGDSLLSYCLCLQVCLSVGIIIVLLFYFCEEFYDLSVYLIPFSCLQLFISCYHENKS
jgi:hypothetical protein